MNFSSVSRRDVLKTLTLGTTTGSVLRMIPLQAAEHVHKIAKDNKAKSPTGSYAPKFFSAHQYKTGKALCQAIIPPDEQSAGAVEAGAPEFIDLLTSEIKESQLRLEGGFSALESISRVCTSN